MIASIREKSGAKINIPSSTGTPERIVTITGHQHQVKEGFMLITQKLEQVRCRFHSMLRAVLYSNAPFQEMNANVSASSTAIVPVTLKLIVPAGQCGSIIGRGGSKIKEIRDVIDTAFRASSKRSHAIIFNRPRRVRYKCNLICFRFLLKERLR